MEVTVTTAGESTVCAWSGSNQMLEIIPAYKEFTLIQDYGYRKNIIQNGDFERERWSDVNTPLSWTKSAGGTWIIQSADGAEFTSANPIVKYLRQVISNGTFKAGERLLLKTKFSAMNAAAIINIMIKLDDGGGTVRHLDDDGSWNVGAVYINGTGNFSIGDILSDPIPIEDGVLEVRIYEVDDSSGVPITAI